MFKRKIYSKLLSSKQNRVFYFDILPQNRTFYSIILPQNRTFSIIYLETKCLQLVFDIDSFCACDGKSRDNMGKYKLKSPVI